MWLEFIDLVRAFDRVGWPHSSFCATTGTKATHGSRDDDYALPVSLYELRQGTAADSSMDTTGITARGAKHCLAD
jgi:hypothetical protein